MEAVAIQCTLPNHAKWLLLCCYRPPDSNDMSDLRSFADNLFPSYDKIIIAGHFNLPNISWTDANYTLVGSLSQNFCDILVTITSCPNFALRLRENKIFWID